MPKKKHTRQKQTARPKQPQWQGIEMLWTFATHIDGMLESSQEQYETLQLAKPKPHVLDDYTVNRVIKVFTTVLLQKFVKKSDGQAGALVVRLRRLLQTGWR
ncbi:MAG TPA: hypothetical protein VEL31_27795 [Ktedonobacteraceae bacterium]|nr:hypothetical protein [Ktedonobacteraceae bacterium]